MLREGRHLAQLLGLIHRGLQLLLQELHLRFVLLNEDARLRNLLVFLEQLRLQNLDLFLALLLLYHGELKCIFHIVEF